MKRALPLILAACTTGPVLSTPPAAHQVPLAQTAVAHGVAATSVDDAGVPRFVRAVRSLASHTTDPEAAAREHLAALAPVWGIDGSAADLELEFVHPLRGGATIVGFQQRSGGVALLHGRVRVLLAASGDLIAVSGTPRAATPVPAFATSAADALRTTIADRTGVAIAAHEVTALRSAGEWQELEVAPRADVHISQARARAVLAGDTAAWMVEVFASTTPDEHAYRVVVDAGSGTVLERDDLTQNDAFQYRVFADADAAGRPFDGPQASYDPRPTSTPDGTQPAFVPPNLVTMDGFNSSHDPWLATDATETVGNNIDAYVDLDDSNDGYTPPTDFRANLTGAKTFDYTFDTATDALANTTQQKAAITNLFYLTNWLHDWWYDSGFNEAAGNAQADNLGRGGVAGDPLLAEAQDDALGGSRDNANMSTPADGSSPRMQMYLWNGPSDSTLTVNGTGYPSGAATFGAAAFDFTGTVVVSNDATACNSVPSNVSGKIAVVDRGTCTFQSKANKILQGGGIGMILVNNVAGGPPGMPADNSNAQTVPSLSVSMDDGAAIKNAVAAGTTTAHMVRLVSPTRDGDIDTTVVAHEWGHYLHHRLTECGDSQQCNAMSEGWGDFDALMTVLRDTDDPHGIFPLAIYATGDSYFGIRRAPYSVDRTVNGLSFKNIQESEPDPTGFPYESLGDNAEVHNAGEVWAEMLWDVYVALVDAHGYAAAHRAMSDYVVAGMQLAPPDETYLDMRDAIITGANAIDPSDAMLIGQAFAGRGAGSCAVGPARDSTTLDGVTESNALSGALAIGAITLTDDQTTCDSDGILDPGETGTLTVQVANPGFDALTGSTLEVTSDAPGVTITQASHTIASLAAFADDTETFTVSLSADAAPATPATFTVTVANAAACAPSVVATATFMTAVDDNAAVSANDDVESSHVVWTKAGAGADTLWNRTPVEGLTTAWVGTDNAAGISDTSLESPPLDVGSGDFKVTVSHRFSFEASMGTDWDGGVVEVSSDGGATWTDVASLGITPGYNVVLSTQAMNPLGGQMAFGATNAAWPSREPLTLDFGTQFSGKTVQIRFRIGSDEAGGDYGWELDDFVFSGITNTPFGALSDEPDICKDGKSVPAPGSGGCCDTRGSGGNGALVLVGVVGLVLRRRRRVVA